MEVHLYDLCFHRPMLERKDDLKYVYGNDTVAFLGINSVERTSQFIIKLPFKF